MVSFRFNDILLALSVDGTWDQRKQAGDFATIKFRLNREEASAALVQWDVPNQQFQVLGGSNYVVPQ